MVNIKKLGDVCDFVRGPFGGSLKKSCFVESGYAVYEQHAIYDQFTDVRYFIDEAKFNEMKRFELKPNDLIMSCSGTMGKVAIVPQNIEKGIINQALLKLTPKKNIDVLYLKYWMSSPDFDKRMQENTVGAAIKNVASVKILKLITIPIPPLAEQKQIVAILDKAFTAIDQAKANIEQNIANAKELFQSKLHDIFSQKGDGWVEKSLGSLCKTSAGGTPLKSKKEHYENGTVPWLRSGEVNNRNIVDCKIKITELGLNNSSAKLFPPRTVLIAMYGATAGQVGILNFECSTNQAVCGILPNEKFIPEFLYYKFLDGKDILIKQAVGGAQPNISQLKIKNTLVPCIELAEQKQIVEKLDVISNEMKKIEIIYKQKIVDLEELKKSILQKAFKGELSI